MREALGEIVKKLAPTHESGLRYYARLALPNALARSLVPKTTHPNRGVENALVIKGFIEQVGHECGPRYVITDAGKNYLTACERCGLSEKLHIVGFCMPGVSS